MNKMNFPLFMMTLIMSVFITISSNSWFYIWMGMEINLMSFLPMMMEKNNLMSKESSLTYFMVQSIASMIMLLAVIMMMLMKEMIMMNNMSKMSKMMLMMSLMMKSGMSPFHFWMPKVMEGLLWNKCLILMTWQKLIPLMIMSNMIEVNLMNIIVMMLSVLVGSIGGLNQTSLRKIMAYSSINNNGWMLAAMLISEMTWLMYFMLYSILTYMMTMTMNLYKNYHINQIMLMKEKSIKKLILMLNMLSMSGLPPMMGFIPKWLLIQSASSKFEMMLMLLMMMLTLITMYYYLRISFSLFMMTNIQPKWNLFKSPLMNSKMLMIINILSIKGIVMISLIMTLY
nr:NADH dehydrogenase subunit 2 [Orthomeria smaragdinum]